jgi:hypothetical protein
LLRHSFDEAVAQRHDQLHRNVGAPLVGLEHALEHVGAVQLDAVAAVLALGRVDVGGDAVEFFQQRRPQLVEAHLPRRRRGYWEVEHADVPGMQQLRGHARDLGRCAGLEPLQHPVTGVVEARAGDCRV